MISPGTVFLAVTILVIFFPSLLTTFSFSAFTLISTLGPAHAAAVKRKRARNIEVATRCFFMISPFVKLCSLTLTVWVLSLVDFDLVNDISSLPCAEGAAGSRWWRR